MVQYWTSTIPDIGHFNYNLENLMGVNNENEPLSGTGPERRLFDKSLQPKLQNVGITLS